jgi:hypothetical protein
LKFLSNVNQHSLVLILFSSILSSTPVCWPKSAHVSLHFVSQRCHPASPSASCITLCWRTTPRPPLPPSSLRRRTALLRRLRVVPAPFASDPSPAFLHCHHHLRVAPSLRRRVVPVPYLTSLIRGCYCKCNQVLSGFWWIKWQLY